MTASHNSSDRRAFYAAARERFRERVQLSGIAGAFRAGQIACGCDGCECALPTVEGAEAAAPEVRVAGVRFADSGKTYYVNPGELELHAGQNVILETSRRREIAQV